MSTERIDPRGQREVGDETCGQEAWFAKPAAHIKRAASLMAAARDELDRYFECVDALSPLMVDVGHVVDAADWLKAAEVALCGGRQ